MFQALLGMEQLPGSFKLSYKCMGHVRQAISKDCVLMFSSWDGTWDTVPPMVTQCWCLPHASEHPAYSNLCMYSSYSDRQVSAPRPLLR